MSQNAVIRSVASAYITLGQNLLQLAESVDPQTAAAATSAAPSPSVVTDKPKGKPGPKGKTDAAATPSVSTPAVVAEDPLAGLSAPAAETDPLADMMSDTAEPAEPAAPVIDKDAVKGVLSKLSATVSEVKGGGEAGATAGRAVLQKLLQKHGGENLSAVPAENYAALHAESTDLLTKVEAMKK